MARRSSLLLAFLLVAFGVIGCGSDTEAVPPADDDTVRMSVAAEQADCVGVAPMRCLQVRYAPGEDWQLFYDGIDGFTYEPGYEYELVVRVTSVGNPPADHSSQRYELVEIASKTPA
ncbi:DUF4377 domain-containing protein [Nocardia cyriacigeorgica]|uniref:DUF4377 domain-containing protein n=1 Tax=Nocardia cyriacigeorgica TaxID=135487 RepID=UPI0024561A46|nr:DUF4377 domain-containing protein [Nocardia cyriacigeorgica]